MTEKETPKKVTRRDFIRDAAIVGGAVTGAGVLTGCGPGTPIATPEVITETVEVTKVVEKEVPVEVTKEVIKEVPVALPKAMGYIQHNAENCAGCRTCLMVCSLYHDGVCSPELARIQVIAPIRKIFEVEAYTCKQCEGPECLWACPVEGALYIDETTGARVIDPEKCIGCQLCLQACPQYPNSPIRYDAERKICLKCDLCGGDPLCVKFCPKSVDLTDIAPSYIPEEDRVLKFVKYGSI
jgi:Fe-S-cluster-containing hydrogenase component 2